MSDIKLSIIIPHYNIPILLRRLLNTIPDRKDIQVIVVDDNSTKDLDKYEEVIKDFSNKNIIFLKNDTHKKGSGGARNKALDCVKGEWLLCADADDAFTVGFVNHIEKYYQMPYDVIFFKVDGIDIDSGLPSDRHIPFNLLIDEYNSDHSHLSELRLRFLHHSPWGKLMRCSYIKELGIAYDEIPKHEDAMFHIKLHHNARITTSDDTLYILSTRANSLISEESPEQKKCAKEVYRNEKDYFKKFLTREEMHALSIGLYYDIRRYIYKHDKLHACMNAIKHFFK